MSHGVEGKSAGPAETRKVPKGGAATAPPPGTEVTIEEDYVRLVLDGIDVQTPDGFHIKVEATSISVEGPIAKLLGAQLNAFFAAKFANLHAAAASANVRTPE